MNLLPYLCLFGCDGYHIYRVFYSQDHYITDD
jgi:hypothetical protein